MRIRLKADALVWQVVDDEVVCLDLHSSKYLAVNAAGAALWDSLVIGASREELVARLLGRFAIAEDRAETDVDAFIADLNGRGLLVTD